MRCALETVLDFITKIGEHDSSLMHLQHVACDCLKTIAEKEKISMIAILNKQARPFYPKNSHSCRTNTET